MPGNYAGTLPSAFPTPRSSRSYMASNKRACLEKKKKKQEKRRPCYARIWIAAQEAHQTVCGSATLWPTLPCALSIMLQMVRSFPFRRSRGTPNHTSSVGGGGGVLPAASPYRRLSLSVLPLPNRRLFMPLLFFSCPFTMLFSIFCF